MREVKRIPPDFSVIPKRKKVAAYARISRNTKRLIHSVSAQISYYHTLIQENPEWEYAGVYADCGLSGTLIAKRNEFQRMLADCETGKIDLILTKSISRFARNTLDLLETVRHLKSLGIEVRFEKEKINSLSQEGEVLLSLLASFAQEESRSISENIKWGIQKRVQAGEIGAANKRIFGYQYDEELKKYRIQSKEAEAIRQIFDLYLQGISFRKIAEIINKSGFQTVYGNAFSGSSVRAIIQNEIYAGDILRQKYFVTDPIRKNKIKNKGQLPQYYMPNCHEAILDREIYKKVQKEIKHRADTTNMRYCFTKKIKCGICGKYFTRKKSMRKGKTYIYWICRSKKDRKTVCKSVNFREEDLKQISIQMLGLITFDEEEFARKVKEIIVLENGSLKFIKKA